MDRKWNRPRAAPSVDHGSAFHRDNARAATIPAAVQPTELRRRPPIVRLS